MAATGAVAVFVIALIVVLVVAAGITPLLLALIVPVAAFFLLIPLFKAVSRGSLRRRTGTPTSAEASYDPVQEPRDRR
jgi:hypothetical protein